jgi:putative flippase GtrA
MLPASFTAVRTRTSLGGGEELPFGPLLMQSKGLAKDSLERSDPLPEAWTAPGDIPAPLRYPAPARRGLVRRIAHGIRHPPNWHQLARFVVVGTSSYMINIATYTLFLKGVGIDYRFAALVAFVVSVSNSFFWNRRWTFRAHAERPHAQIPRFLTIYGVALSINLGVLELLVAGFDVPKIEAQAIAALCATPFSFLGNKLWTFRHPAASARAGMPAVPRS